MRLVRKTLWSDTRMRQFHDLGSGLFVTATLPLWREHALRRKCRKPASSDRPEIANAKWVDPSAKAGLKVCPIRLTSLSVGLVQKSLPRHLET